MNGILTIYILTVPLSQIVCLTSQCRSRFGLFQPEDFSFHACALCYVFLYPQYEFKTDPQQFYLSRAVNNSYMTVKADILNDTSVSSICSTLISDECGRWKRCCNASQECCQRQQESPAVDVSDMCHPTWDGFGCWDSGTPGQNSYISCPNFIKYSRPTQSAIKTCLRDGSWLMKGTFEWTNYTNCYSNKELNAPIYTSGGGQIIFLVHLVPSIMVFHLIRFHHL